MDTIFEDPTTLVYIAGAVAAVLFLIWRGSQSKGVLYGMLAALCVAGGLLAADALVETEREYLESTVDRIASELEQKQGTTFLANLDDDYTGFGGNKAGLTKLANSRIKSTLIDSISIKECEIELTGELAKMNVLTRVMPGGAKKGLRVLLRLTVRWQKRPDVGWRIISATKPKIVMPFGQ